MNLTLEEAARLIDLLNATIFRRCEDNCRYCTERAKCLDWSLRKKAKLCKAEKLYQIKKKGIDNGNNQ